MGLRMNVVASCISVVNPTLCRGLPDSTTKYWLLSGAELISRQKVGVGIATIEEVVLEEVVVDEVVVEKVVDKVVLEEVVLEEVVADVVVVVGEVVVVVEEIDVVNEGDEVVEMVLVVDDTGEDVVEVVD